MQDHKDVPNSSLLALPFALAHPAISSSPKVLCTAARVCKHWRQAVQECAGCNTDVHFKLGSRSKTSSTMAAAKQLRETVAGPASWLDKHRPLVRSLILDPWCTVDAGTAAAVSEAAVQLLRTAMQPQQQQQQQQELGLHLRSFSSDTTWAVGLLPVLPAHSLTHLDLEDSRLPDDAAAAVAASNAAVLATEVPRLSSLQQLVLRERQYQGVPQFNSCLSVLGQLSRLTRLEVNTWVGSAEDLPDEAAQVNSALQQRLAQPLSQLQELYLTMMGGKQSVDELPLLDMSRLQQLQKLVCSRSLPGVPAPPARLRHLDVGCCRSSQQLSDILQLQQLTALSLEVDLVLGGQESLLRLTQLPALQELRLSIQDPDWAVAVAAAPAWGQLPQLCELKVYCEDQYATAQQLAAVVAGVAAATTLTKLDLWLPCLFNFDEDGGGDGLVGQVAAGVDGAQQQGPVDICASIAGLKCLKHLSVELLTEVADSAGLDPRVVLGDVCAVTALTGLTHLQLLGGGVCVSDAVAVALACCLMQLHHLNLENLRLESMACLAAIAHLPQLQGLCLHDNPGITRQGLMLLTRLSRLQCLEVDRNNEVTDAVIESFWSALHGGNGN